MKLVYTVCSNNYLAQAKILGDSLIAHNPEYTFIICLVDTKQLHVDYSFFNPHTIIEIADIPIPEFQEICAKYNIIELNTAVKASCAKYIFQIYPNTVHLFYFDPDIMIFNSLQTLEADFRTHDILLTPHIFTPIPLDGLVPQESVFLNYGIYNLGFIGLKNNSTEVSKLLDWWEERTIKQGYIRVCEGIFVDQLYMNHVPLFFKNVKILEQYGYNAAPWNLHERSFTNEHGKYIMNDGSNLVFYHVSSYSYKKPEQLSRGYTRYSFENKPFVKPLYQLYYNLLIQNKANFYSNIPCCYVHEQEALLQNQIEEQKQLELIRINTLKSKIKKIVLEICPPLLFKIIKKFSN